VLDPGRVCGYSPFTVLPPQGCGQFFLVRLACIEKTTSALQKPIFQSKALRPWLGPMSSLLPLRFPVYHDNIRPLPGDRPEGNEPSKDAGGFDEPRHDTASGQQMGVVVGLV